jgi:hypothetical protein
MIGQTRRWYVFSRLCLHLRFTRFLTPIPPPTEILLLACFPLHFVFSLVTRGSHTFILGTGSYRRLRPSFLLIAFCILEPIPSGRYLLIASTVFV